MKILSICMLVWVALVFNAFAEDITTVKMAAPGDDGKFAWPVLTSDGTGLYNKIYDNIFGAQNIKVEIIIVPVLRCKFMVMTGEADFFPGGVKDESYKGYTFVTPQYAIWHTKGIAVLFKKSTISNWNGIDFLKGKSIVSARGTDHIRELEKYGEKFSSEIENAHEHRTPEGALKMVMADRMDVYISSIELMEVAMNVHKKAFNADQYQIEFLGRQKFYPLFQDTERGKQLAEIFDKGMRQFYKSGHLTTWYKESPYAAFENIDSTLMKK